MRARAPGKVVLSGAYAVLEGAPALVTAVDRYVVADSAVAAAFEAPEARAAIPSGPLPHIDVSETRLGGRKLGVGSSAAIVVASLAAKLWEREPGLVDREVAESIWQPAVLAHRAAQGGGSGIDVVTSAFGGTRNCKLDQGLPTSEAHALPVGLCIELYAARDSASTPEMLASVRAFAASRPQRYGEIMNALCVASTRAAATGVLDEFIEAVGEQSRCLAELGAESGAPIVPAPIAALSQRAQWCGVAVHPSGAGGGDIVLCMGREEGCLRWRCELESLGFEHLGIAVNARGVHRSPR